MSLSTLVFGESSKGESPSGPPWALLVLGWAAFLLGGLRSETAWLLWSGFFWLLVWWSPPDGPTLFRTDLWLAWVGWLLLSSLWSLEPLYSLHVFWRRATIVAFFTLASSWWGVRERRAWVAGLFGLGAFAGAFYVLGAWTGKAPDGLLPPNPNYTGCLLGASAGAAFWVFAPSDSSRGRRLAAAAFAACVLAVVAWMRSRGAFFAFACSAGAWSLFNRNLKAPLAALAVAVAIAVCMPSSALPWLLKMRDPLSYERPKLWLTAVSIATKNPWLGVGPGCFERAYFRMRGPIETGLARYSHYTGHAHSEPLHLAAETGWLGLAFMVWALGLFLPGPRPASFESRAAQGALWAVLAHSFVDGVLALPALELLFFGALACSSEPGPPAFRFGPSRWRWLGLAGLALSLLTWLPAQRAQDAEQQAMAPGQPPDFQTRTLDGLLSFLSGRPTHRAQIEAVLAAEPARLPELRVEFLKEALAVRPKDSFLRDELAAVYASEAPPNTALALWELDQAIASNPTYARFQVQKAQLLLLAGDFKAAGAAAREALNLEPNFAFAALILGESSLALGDAGQAREALRRIEIIRGLRIAPASTYDQLLLDLPEQRYLRLRAALESGS